MPSAASCVVKALVEATPISGPARVSMTSSDSRTSELSGTLQIASVRQVARLRAPGAAPPACRRSRRTARWSRTASSAAPAGCGSGIRWRCRPRTGGLADLLDEVARHAGRRGSSCRRRRYARAAVRLNTSVAAGPNAASSSRPLATRSCSVSATARGCSWISFSMKWRYWPFSAASATSSLSRTGRSTAVAVAVDDRAPIAPHLGDIALLQEHEAARHRQQRGDIRGDEVLLDAQSDDHRAALARDDQAVRIVLAHHRERVGALELGHRRAHRLEQVADRRAGGSGCDGRSPRCRSRR